MIGDNVWNSYLTWNDPVTFEEKEFLMQFLFIFLSKFGLSFIGLRMRIATFNACKRAMSNLQQYMCCSNNDYSFQI